MMHKKTKRIIVHNKSIRTEHGIISYLPMSKRIKLSRRIKELLPKQQKKLSYDV